jgi:hypothetical protein
LGHIAADCPELRPAANYAEHLARIAEYVRRMHAHEITPAEKRHMITAENQLWHGSAARSTK